MRAWLLAVACLLGAPTSGAADDGTCAVPLSLTQVSVGQMVLVNVVVVLQSPGSLYVCPALPADALAVRFTMRRKLPASLDLPHPVLDPCVSYLDLGSHPVDGFARIQLRDTAGSPLCPEVPARLQMYFMTWYVTP